MTPLCNLDEIEENESREFTLEHDGADLRLFAVKRDGIIYAYKNNCPHLGIPLNLEEHRFLDSEQHFVICSTHGALFQVEDGLCVSGPCQGDALSALEVVIKGQEVFVGKDLS